MGVAWSYVVSTLPPSLRRRAETNVGMTITGFMHVLHSGARFRRRACIFLCATLYSTGFISRAGALHVNREAPAAWLLFSARSVHTQLVARKEGEGRSKPRRPPCRKARLGHRPCSSTASVVSARRPYLRYRSAKAHPGRQASRIRKPPPPSKQLASVRSIRLRRAERAPMANRPRCPHPRRIIFALTEPKKKRASSIEPSPCAKTTSLKPMAVAFRAHPDVSRETLVAMA